LYCIACSSLIGGENERFIVIFHGIEEAAEEFGADKLKIYRSTFTPMYYSMVENKVKCSMKLICLLPDEKVSCLPLKPKQYLKLLFD